MILLSSTVCKPWEGHTGETCFIVWQYVILRWGDDLHDPLEKTQYEHQLITVSLNYSLARLVAAQAAVQYHSLA